MIAKTKTSQTLADFVTAASTASDTVSEPLTMASLVSTMEEIKKYSNYKPLPMFVTEGFADTLQKLTGKKLFASTLRTLAREQGHDGYVIVTNDQIEQFLTTEPTLLGDIYGVKIYC